MDITTFIASKREQALLLGNYGSYRTALSRRLLTVRRRLGRTTPKGRKYTSKSPITSDEIGQNHEYVHLILLVSERAWAHGMHMRSVHAADTSQEKITGATRKHIISRFHKAAVNAESLVLALRDHKTSRAHNRDVLEAQAYYASLLGAAAFEKAAWDETLKHYSKSHVIYSVLGKVSKQDVFKDFQSSTIDPSIRYAAYRCQLPRTIGIPTIARQRFPRAEKELVTTLEKMDPDALNEKPTVTADASASRPSNLPKTIAWRSRTVELQDAAIAVALGSVNDASSALSKYMSSTKSKETPFKEKAAAYDNVLIASQDAADATKRAIDELSADGVGQGDKRMQDLQVTRTAVNYSLIGWRVGRNRVLDGELNDTLPKAKASPKLKKKAEGAASPLKEEGSGRRLARLRERIALYDATLQSLDSVKELPGVAADDAFLKELEGKRTYFQAFKCLLTARSHAILENRKNALALLARALDLSSKSTSLLSSSSSSSIDSDLPSLDIDPKHQKALHEHLTQEVNRFRALVEIENVEHQHSKSNKTLHSPMIDNMNEYPTNNIDLKNLVTYPPKLEPVPVKPLFLDVAWNYIEYPGRSKSAAEKGEATATAESGSQQSKKGWFGFGR